MSVTVVAGSRGINLTIAATSLGFALVQLDVSVLNVALARIGAALGTGVTGLTDHESLAPICKPCSDASVTRRQTNAGCIGTFGSFSKRSSSSSVRCVAIPRQKRHELFCVLRIS
jgi:hypothetical protein